VAGGRAVAAFPAVARVPVLGSGVAEGIAVDVPEIPCLVGQDRLAAAGALVEAGRDRRS
jgi:hypothetical protein